MNKSKKLSCNIIKDLLPSYYENICTQDTKNAVNEHLAECEKCQNLVNQMFKIDFVSTKTESLEINYMKKIKRHFIKKGSLGGMILALFIICGLAATLNTYNIYSRNTYFIMLPLMLIATKILIPAEHQKIKMRKSQKLQLIISVVLTCYGVAVTMFFLLMLEQENFSLCMPLNKVGPFLYYQYLTITLYQVIMYLKELFHIMRDSSTSFFYMGIYLTGGMIMLAEISHQKILTDNFLSAYYYTIQTTFLLLLESMIVIILLSLIEKIIQRKS